MRRSRMKRSTLVSTFVGTIFAALTWVFTVEFSKTLPSAEPTSRPGLFLLIIIPIAVAFVYWRTGDIVPTFLISLLPVFTVYYVHYNVYAWGVIVDFSVFESSDTIVQYTILYWLLGIIVALLSRHAYRNLGSNRGGPKAEPEQ